MNKPKAYIIGSVYLPISELSNTDLKTIRTALSIKDNRKGTVTMPSRQAQVFEYETLYGVDYIKVPRVYGEQYLKDFEVVDWTAEGNEGCLSNVRKGVPRDHQPPFIDTVLSLLLDYYDVMAEAYTGSGKSFCCIEIARRIGTSTLIIVDQSKLALQWVDTLTDLFGLEESEIGHYDGYSKEYEGRPFCIAMLQSLYKAGDSIPDFYDEWGLTIIDESHSSGSQRYSEVLMNISSKYRLGVSATTDRRDLFQAILHAHLGEVAYTLPNSHKPSEIWYVEYNRLLSSYANNSSQAGKYESSLALDGDRNRLIADIVKDLYDQGRDILVIGSRAVQLHGLMALCKALDIPSEDMGVFSQSLYYAGYAKDKEPKAPAIGWDGTAFYTSVKFGIHNVRSGKIRKEVQDKAIKARIIFSTYSMFSKGVDVPRLSVGIDATPRAKVIQAHGRILRTEEGKPTPVWVTLRDYNNIRSEGQFIRRLSDYAKSNAKEVKLWHVGNPPMSVDIQDLKREINRNITRLAPQRIKVLPNGEHQLIS